MVAPSYYPIIGGTETVVKVLATKLNEMGIHADVMTYNMNRKWDPIWREETETNGLFKVFRVPAFNLSSVFQINPLELLRVHLVPKPSFTKKFEEYDIIHFQGETDLGFPLLSYFIRKPKIFHCHRDVVQFPRLKNLFRRIFLCLADLYIASRLKVLLDLGVPRSKGLALPFGVDVEIFQPDETKKVDNLVLFVGRIAREKGLHVLLQALHYVTVRTQLIIIGPKWDMEYAEACMDVTKQIADNGFHNVRYLGDMDLTSLVPWYQKAAVLVRPDPSGVSGGLTSLEALACGTPVIGTGNHIIKDRVNGILVPPNNPKELAKALSKLLENKELRENYGREGRRIVEQHFSWERFVEKLAEVYETMLSHYQRSS